MHGSWNALVIFSLPVARLLEAALLPFNGILALQYLFLPTWCDSVYLLLTPRGVRMTCSVCIRTLLKILMQPLYVMFSVFLCAAAGRATPSVLPLLCTTGTKYRIHGQHETRHSALTSHRVFCAGRIVVYYRCSIVRITHLWLKCLPLRPTSVALFFFTSAIYSPRASLFTAVLNKAIMFGLWQCNVHISINGTTFVN